MFGLAINNIYKRKTRSILTILGILVVMLLYIVITGIMHTYEKDLQSQLSAMAGHIIVQQKTDSGGGSFYSLDTAITEREGRDILNMRDIDRNKSSLVFYQSVVGTWKPNLPPVVLCVGIEPGKEEAFFLNTEIKGSRSLNGSHDIILGSYAASYYETEQGAKLGSTVIAKGEKFRIIGILSDVSSVINNSMIMPLQTAQEMYVRNGLISSIILTPITPDATNGLVKEIESKYPKLMAATEKELQKGVDDMLSALRDFMSMIGNTIIVIAIFMIMIVMFMSVNERKKEIGTLKAIGAPGYKILGMITVESLILCVIGGLLALPVSIPFEQIMTSEIYTDFSIWIKTMVVTVIIGVISSIWPAWSAQRVNPLESLKYE